MPTYIVLLASKDPEFPLGENRHSHHAHLAFRTVAHLYSSRSERETTLSSPLGEERLLSPHPPRVPSPYVRSFLIFARVRLPPCTCTSRLLFCAHPTPGPTLLFSATLLSCRAAPLIRFRFQPEGPGESPWRATRMKSVTGIQATLAQTERERLLARAASRGSICIPLSRGYRSQTSREITREEIFGIEWAIMRLHLNNLRGVDWAQAGAGVEIERSRGALGFAVADRWRCRSSFDRLLRGFGRVALRRLFAWNEDRAFRWAWILGGTRRI